MGSNREPDVTSIMVVIGAASAPGRVARAAAFLAEVVSDLRPDAEVAVVDLGSSSVEFCDGRSLEAYEVRTRDLVEKVVRSDAVAFAFPIYRASYPGVLKNLLDLLPVKALRNKPVGVIAMGASPHHYLAADMQLRPVLSWFGALTLPTAVYLTSVDFRYGEVDSETAQDDLRALGVGLLTAVSCLRGVTIGPGPLAGHAQDAVIHPGGNQP